MRRAGLTALLLLAGCVSAPVPIEQDAALRGLGQQLDGWSPPTLAVVPASFPYLRAPAASVIDGEVGWANPPLDARRLQHRWQKLLAWSLHPSEATAPWPSTVEVPGLTELKPGAQLAAVCRAADDNGAALVARLEVLENRIAFQGRVWPVAALNFVLVYGVGFLPAYLFPDEDYALTIKARFSVTHARSERPLFSRTYSVGVAETLNDFQRGFNATGILFLYEWTIDPDDDLLEAYETLLPHALRKLEVAVARDLRKELPPVLADPDTRALLRDGVPEKGRTLALVIGKGDLQPLNARLAEQRTALRAEDGPYPLQSAEPDARAVAQHLVASGTVRPLHLKRVIGPKTGAPIFAALDALGARALRNDRLLVYFSGYGTTTSAGEPALVLEDGPLPLRKLAERCLAAVAPNYPQVVFLLDTSFGTRRGGRSYRWPREDPGGAEPKAGFLSVLGVAQRRWTVLAAANRTETAIERTDEPRGLFTHYLLLGLRGAADSKTNPDGVVSVDELHAYVCERVRTWSMQLNPDRLQTPQMEPRGAKGIPVGRYAVRR